MASARRRSGRRQRGAPDGPTRSVLPASPLIEITPTPEEYEQLCRDLAKLRELGAPSNTAAVLAAVHAAAAGGKIGHGKHERAGRR